MKKTLRILWATIVWMGLFGLTGCTITPGIGIGLDLDYSGGEFHVRPNASVGLYGRP